MAGLYIHIPFCETRCIYCDFYSNTKMEKRSAFISALCKEMESRKDYLNGEQISTIYFGGGTPSQLNANEIQNIFNHINLIFANNTPADSINTLKEVTIEVNPDDLTPEYISSLRRIGFNRVSMGVQSFNDRDLRFLNRRHDAKKAIEAVNMLKHGGFNNISIDLIYGLPGQTLEEWKENLDIAISLDVQHISSYHLIYEEGTRLYRLLQKGDVSEVNEELSLEMFRTLISTLKQAGFNHYEISNFAKPGFESKHNSSYWLGEKYLGLGPSAHSYNLENRSWNVSNLDEYIRGESPRIEHLTKQDRFNDLILTSLRTMWGLDLEKVSNEFGEQYLSYTIEQAEPYIRSGMMMQSGNILRLSPEGIFISDGIMSDMMMITDDDDE